MTRTAHVLLAAIGLVASLAAPARAHAPEQPSPSARPPALLQVADDWNPFKRSRDRDGGLYDLAPGHNRLYSPHGVTEEGERRDRRIDRSMEIYKPAPTTDYSRQPITPITPRGNGYSRF